MILVYGYFKQQTKDITCADREKEAWREEQNLL